MNTWTNDNPTYHEYPIPEFCGNPLIEALNPPALDTDEAINRLSKRPDFDKNERNMPAVYRSLLPKRLMSFMFPTGQHVRLMQNLYGQILDGYRHRNPLTPEGQNLLYNAGNLLSSTPLQTPAKISMITGLSGMGKSTTIRAIMNTIGNPVIKHHSYKGEALTESQIIFMMRNVPDQHSAKAVCKSFGDHAEDLLGDGRYSKLFASNSATRTQYVGGLKKIIASHHVGALIIDEFQNISVAKSGGKAELLSLIINLRDELGIPIILVGTYRTAALFRDDPSSARRLIEGGFYELARPSSPQDNDWNIFCRVLWNFQWVQKPLPLSDEIVENLYNCSQGIIGIAISLFVASQEHAINNGIETISAKLLKDIYRDRLRPVHGIIEILRRNDPAELENYDELYFKCMDQMSFDPIQSRLETLTEELSKKAEVQRRDLQSCSAKSASKSLKNMPTNKKKITEKSIGELLKNKTNTVDLFGGAI